MGVLYDMGVGAIAGLLVAVGGAIKDAPYEGFDPAKFVRSPIVGAVEAPVIGYLYPKASRILIGLSTIATERLTVELYKLARASQGTYMPAKFVVGEWGVQKNV